MLLPCLGAALASCLGPSFNFSFSAFGDRVCDQCPAPEKTSLADSALRVSGSSRLVAVFQLHAGFKNSAEVAIMRHYDFVAYANDHRYSHH